MIVTQRSLPVSDITLIVAGPEPEPAPGSAPCRGACEQAFERAVIALEDEAAQLGFEVTYIGLRHTRCGTLRASATAARRGIRELLRKRDALVVGGPPVDTDG